MRLVPFLRGFIAALFAILLAPSVLGITIVTGTQGVGSGEQERRPYDYSPEFSLLDPNGAPFFHFLNHLETRPLSSIVYKLFEDDEVALETQINNGNLASGDTSLTVDDGSIVVTGSDTRVINTRTKEVMLITAVSSNTWTATRGYNSTSAAALLDGDTLRVLNEEITEGDGVPPVITTTPNVVTNYAQHIKTTFAYTKDSDKEERRGPSDRFRQMELSMMRHRKKMEHCLRFNPTAISTGSAPNTNTVSKGFEGFVTTNIIDAEGSLSAPDWNDILKTAFRYGSGRKLCFAGREAVAAIDTIWAGQVQISQSETTYGLSVRKVRSSHGELDIINDHTLDGGYRDRMHIVDPVYIKRGDFRAIEMTEQDVSKTGPDFTDIVKGYWGWVGGLWLRHEKAHVVVKGITTLPT